MKGIVRCIDSLGRVVLPKEVRNILGITYGSPVEMIEVDGGVFVKKYKDRSKCCICNEEGELEEVEVDGQNVCPKCISKIVKKFK